MFDSPRFRSAALVCLAALTLAACGNKDKADPSAALTATDGVLAYVPADTPYLFASGAPMPDDLLDKLEPGTDRMLRAYQNVVREVMREALRDDDTDAELKGGETDPDQIYAVMDELTSLMSIEGLREAGITRDSKFVLYGNGLVPVVRLEVSDAKLFDAAIARIETAAGADMEVAELDGKPYRYIGDDEAKLVVGIFGNNAVMTIAPAGFDDEQLKALFGLTRPSQSIASSGRLLTLVRDHGLTDHYVGYFDTVRFASIFLDEPVGLDRVLLENAEYDASTISATCKAEIRGMAAIAPLVVFGYDEISESVLSGKMIVQLRDDLASAMTNLAAVVPGLGVDGGGLASFGMSFDLEAIRAFYEARLDAMESEPYECEYLQDIQDGVAQGRMALQQPVPPMVYGMRGFNFVVDDASDLNFASGAPPEDLDATVLLAIDDAQALVAMGAMFSPELASLNLQPDGKPVALNVQQVSMVTDSAYAAMTGDALAVSIGENADDRAAGALRADSVSPPVTMAVSMNASLYYELLAQSIMEPTDSGEELSLETREALRDSFLETSKLYDRMSFGLRFTERGIEVNSQTTLAD